jgi:hypothetical protein
MHAAALRKEIYVQWKIHDPPPYFAPLKEDSNEK